MARHIALLSLFIAHCLCMQMRETVERTVMVRTTGSDLQPAATGFIYKQENDGEASVIEMGESEVMEHLAKIYKQPKGFASPIPAPDGPFNANDEDEKKTASDNKERFIPVKEDEIDGIVEDDYKKILKDYEEKLDDRHGYDEYLRKLGKLDGFYHKYDDDDDDDKDKGYQGYKVKKHYNNGDVGDYHTEKFESYKLAGHRNEHDDAGAYGQPLKDNHDIKRGYYGYKSDHDKDKEQKVGGFHKYNDNQDKKDHDIYDNKSNGHGYNKFGSSEYHSSDDGYKKAGSHESKHKGADFGKSGEQGDQSGEKLASHSYEGEEDSSGVGRGKFSSEGGNYNGKSYGFKIKH